MSRLHERFEYMFCMQLRSSKSHVCTPSHQNEKNREGVNHFCIDRPPIWTYHTELLAENYPILNALFQGRDGGMAGWRDGGMAGWRDGGMAGWRDGGMAGWRDGGMAGWRDGGIFRVSMFSLCSSPLHRGEFTCTCTRKHQMCNTHCFIDLIIVKLFHFEHIFNKIKSARNWQPPCLLFT